MKKIFFIFLFMIAILPVQAQDTVVNSIEPSGVFGELEIGEILIFQNTTIKFIEVVSDSRCPKNVKCIWVGEAKVLVGIYNNGEKISEEIITIASNLKQFPVLREFGLALDFLGLSPYPDVTDPIQKNEYRLNLVVKRLPES